MATKVFQLKISLKGIRPPIWRRVLVRGDTTLDGLHEIVQEAMGWWGHHLYSFDIAGLSYTDSETALDFGDEEAAGVRLDALLRSEGTRFLYTYDFGDNWEHVIEVEKIVDPTPGARYPSCIAGRRACPPEDVGGVWGYEEFLEAIKDPNHEEHAEMLEWVGEGYDPEEFDLDEVDRGLQGVG